MNAGTKKDAAQNEYARPHKHSVFLTPSHFTILVAPAELSAKVKYTTATLRVPRFEKPKSIKIFEAIFWQDQIALKIKKNPKDIMRTFSIFRLTSIF